MSIKVSIRWQSGTTGNWSSEDSVHWQWNTDRTARPVLESVKLYQASIKLCIQYEYNDSVILQKQKYIREKKERMREKEYLEMLKLVIWSTAYLCLFISYLHTWFYAFYHVTFFIPLCNYLYLHFSCSIDMVFVEL